MPPHVKALPGGTYHVSEIMAPRAATASALDIDDDRDSPAQTSDSSNLEAILAVEEFLQVASTLKRTLSDMPPTGARPRPRLRRRRVTCTPLDVVYVHLYLSDMSHFALINIHYEELFGAILPPSRSCVSVGGGTLPGGRRVCMDCIVQRGSGSYMRSSLPLLPPSSSSGEDEEGEDEFVRAARINIQSSLRHTLHVQSISSWAPVCVGPYSQSNTVRGCLTFLAGQIGLDPPSMTLVGSSSRSADERGSSDEDERRGGGGKNGRSSWEEELTMSWRNAASVLDAQPGGRRDPERLPGRDGLPLVRCAAA